MKKIVIVLLNLILIMSAFAFQFGCSGGALDTDVTITHDFTISKTEISLEVGQEYQLISSCGDCVINYSTDNADTATITNAGLIKAVKVGTAFITVSSQHENTKRVCKVTVIAPEYSIEFVDEGEYKVFVGAYKIITAKTLHNGVEYAGSVTFSVENDDAKILSVDGNSATLSFSAAGTYEVFATDTHGVKSKIVITVIDNE